ncbi:hypothetical protein MTBBW1_10069 [Desulfamplus magnetovallimortis]|uniref:Uncharacterized protein n=1 Tax=Desulfamplus magnetovallimortis TaxID=1246637 RepID=A0A1W1H4K7_9BACT|nr:hypothetical protein MTBBW1_10069 [Desulfamplus magnetovallimortis]
MEIKIMKRFLNGQMQPYTGQKMKEGTVFALNPDKQIVKNKTYMKNECEKSGH